MLSKGIGGLRRQLLLGAAAAGIGCLSLGAAFAQGSAPAAAPAAENVDEKVTVTARKKKEALKDAPVTVTAFTPATIERLNIQSIDDVARFTPGLSFSKTFGRSTDRPVIRGQSNVLANVQFGVESGAAYFIDGMYYGGSIQTLDLGDVERVEVIKGPQSALFGRNTYSGAINFITRSPGEEFRVTGGAKFASHGNQEFKASVDVPVSEELGFRVAVRDYKYDGEYTNVVNGETVGSEASESISAVVGWNPHDDFSLRLRAQYSRDDDGTLPLFLQSAAANNCMPGYRSLAFFAASGSTNNNQYYCGVIKPQNFVNLNTGPRTNPIVPVAGVPTGIVAGFGGTVYNSADGIAFEGVERETTIIGGIANWDIMGSGYTFIADFSYRGEDEKFGSDSDHSGVNYFTAAPGAAEAFFANTSRDDIKEFVYEARLSTPDDNWIRASLGVFYYNQENTGFDITFADPTGTRFLDDILEISNKAIFGLVEADITKEISATLEARYAEEEKDFKDYNAATGALLFDRTAKFNRMTPRLTVRWKPEDNLTFYAIYAEGVKPGGLNGSLGVSVGKPAYAQETSKNQEIGMKAEWLDGMLVTNVAAYHIDSKNVQLTTAVPPIPPATATTSIVTNQGAGETWGLELDFRAFVSKNFNFGGSYSWTDPKFVSGCDEDQWILTSGGGLLATTAGVGTGTQAGAAFPTAFGNCLITGNRYPLVPAHQATLSAEYRTDPILQFANQNFEGFVQADMSYESSKFVQVHNLAETGSTTLFGARVGIEGENWTLAAFGRNLTDEDTVTLCTRWFTTPYGFGGPPLNSSAPAGFSRSSPRGFFCGLRPGRSIGLELKFDY
jgi:outer membrane receptor protein involved in Fe transport